MTNPDRENGFYDRDFRGRESGSRNSFSQPGFLTPRIRIAKPVFADRISDPKNPDRETRFLNPDFRTSESGSRNPFSQLGFAA